MMWTTKRARVRLDERAVLFRDGLPFRALGPGIHRVLVWNARLTEQRWNTRELVFDALPEVRAILPAEWFREVTVDTWERAVVFRDGRPQVYLRPGTYRVWTVDPSVEVRRYLVTDPMPELTDELAAVIPRREYVDVTVGPNQRGLRTVGGRLDGALEPGRYTEWSTPQAEVAIDTVDVRLAQVALVGQELMTRDKVTLRLTLTAEYAIADPALAFQAVASARDAVYLAVQLAARDFVASVTLDAMLEGRDEMTRFLEARVIPKAAAFGVRVERVGVKDIVLPGDMKALMNRVIEAEKQAAAQTILRREEAQATRSMANTARVMADQPVLLRLKELDTLKEIAERIDEVRVVVGSEGLERLVTSKLLAPGASE